MPDKLGAEDVESAVIDRDEDGEIIPEEHVIDWGGEERRVETKPITTGLINELSHIDDAIADLEPEAVYEAFQTIYVEPYVDYFDESDIKDMEFQYLEALMQPLDEQMEENIGGGSGNPRAEIRNRQ